MSKNVSPVPSGRFSAPAWVKDAVFYQIFPDRFCRSAKYKAVGKFVDWDTLPTRENMFGGNLVGICEKLEYIASLGVNAIYLCPIFKSNSNHRYHTVDYFEIDPVLGTLKDFDKLVKNAHKLGLRVILDGVFNHCSRGFFQFNSLMELGKNSPYVDWFHVHGWPLHAYSGKPNYDCWWGYPALPKFNTDNPDVRDYLFSVGEYWMKRGIDGWRLDVPNEIDDDSFWQEFRRRIKAINPDAYIVGEIWDEPSRWLQGDQFDGVMNYQFRKAVLAYLFDEKPIDVAEFAKRLQDAFPEGRFGVPMNLLGSHDTIRLASLPCSNLQRVKLALALLFFLPGAPCIYYGEEIGMLGGKDPDNRRSFPWDKFPEMHKAPVYDYLKSLIALRNKERVLRDGSLEIAYSAGRLEIVRTLGKKKMTLAISAAKPDPAFEIND
ncbi:glycoside hydrolase family 13 protein [Fibrobacter succinogenes]|uniref:Pullulanase /isoamylase n=1 Tax=Fibrobacter succinogenes TaxID=833 RepID=A0A380S4S8_FIBSU|nr:glycoside hydrolase family 13 protein [Fibrobacter succinogenes]PWJ35470.1 glycosidase [Fibrobacter succinogenes subsp. elongatus]SUQ24125.1 pullulanase /isoamylase [Fibrobacter succinogenes]